MGTTERIARSYGYREQVARTTSWGHRFLFFNILLTCLIGTAYVYAAPDTGSFSAFCYLIITWIGQMSFLAFIIYLVILFPLSFIGKFRLYRWLAGGVATACHAVLLFDAKLFLTVKVHLSLTSLGLILRDLDFKTGLNYNFLYLAIPLIIALEVLIARYSTRSLYRHGHSLPYRIAVVVFILSFVSSHLIHIWADASRYERIQILRPVFPAHFPMTARSFLESHGWLNESLSDRADAADAVEEGIGPEGRALVLGEHLESGTYETRIYQYQGNIVQEYAIAGHDYAPDRAQVLAASAIFDFTYAGNLLTVTTDQGSFDVALRSAQGGGNR